MSKTVYAYNKYFYEFLKEVKQASKERDTDLYKELKDRYTVKDNATTHHIESLMESLTDDMKSSIIANASNVDTLGSLALLDTNTLGDITQSCEVKNISLYILLFTYLGLLHKEHSENAEELLRVLGECQHTESDVEIDNVINEDLQGLLRQIHVMSKPAPTSFEDALSNSSIGSLAREIASDINLDNVNITSPEDIFKGENSKLIGDIVGKVTSNLQTKMQNGSLNQEQIMKEAMSLMGTMGNNDMFKNMMNAMGGQGGMNELFKNMGGAHSSSRARDRLAKKLADKKK